MEDADDIDEIPTLGETEELTDALVESLAEVLSPIQIFHQHITRLMAFCLRSDQVSNLH